MALGYEGYVSLKVASAPRVDVALGTAGGVPRSRERLESSSGYGGKIDETSPGSGDWSEMGVGLPRNYDWEVYDGSMDFDVHVDFLTNQIKEWLFFRQSAAEVNFKTREGNVQTFESCFWNSINLTASADAFLTGSIGFVAMERDSYTRGGNYIGNKEGGPTLCSTPPPYFADPLNPNSEQAYPIPYWQTFVTIDSSLVDFTTWTLEFTQEVVKFFGCEHNVNPVEPKFVAVGPMTATFSGDYMFVNTAAWLSPNTLTSLYVTMGAEVIKLENLELTTDSDSLQGVSDIVPVSVEYAAYELVA